MTQFIEQLMTTDDNVSSTPSVCDFIRCAYQVINIVQFRSTENAETKTASANAPLNVKESNRGLHQALKFFNLIDN